MLSFHSWINEGLRHEVAHLLLPEGGRAQDQLPGSPANSWRLRHTCFSQDTRPLSLLLFFGLLLYVGGFTWYNRKASIKDGWKAPVSLGQHFFTAAQGASGFPPLDHSKRRSVVTHEWTVGPTQRHALFKIPTMILASGDSVPLS